MVNRLRLLKDSALLEKPLKLFRGFARDHWITISRATFGGSFMLWVVFTSDEFQHISLKDVSTWFGIGLVVGIILFFVLDLRRRTSVSKLERQLNSSRLEAHQAQESHIYLAENVRGLVETYLIATGTGRLEIDTNSNFSDRLTLYVFFDPDSFVPVGRYSNNTHYRRMDRTHYNGRQGCLSQAWNNGECFAACLPDPHVDKEGYLDAQVSLDMPRHIAEGLNMKSRHYYAKRIDGDAPSRTPLAVIVFESERPNRHTKDALRTVFSETEQTILAEMIRVLSPHFGRPGLAKEVSL